MAIFKSDNLPVDRTKEQREFYIVFTATKPVAMIFDEFDGAHIEAEAQSRRYPGDDIKIWGFRHISTVRVPTGEPLTWTAGSSVDEAIKAKKEAGKQILDNPFDLVDKKIEEVKEIHG